MRQVNVVVCSVLRAAFPPARGTASYSPRPRWARLLAPRAWAEAYIRGAERRDALRHPGAGPL